MKNKLDQLQGRLEWRRGAACRNLPGELFFPAGAKASAIEETAAAKAVCAGCDVRSLCLEFALSTRQEFGVWGGTDEDERRRIWRGAKLAPAAV